MEGAKLGRNPKLGRCPRTCTPKSSTISVIALFSVVVCATSLCMAAVLPATPVVYSTSSSPPNDNEASSSQESSTSSLGKINKLYRNGGGETMPKLSGRPSAAALGAMQDELAMNRMLAQIAISERNGGASNVQGVDSSYGESNSGDDVVRGKTALLLNVVRGLRATEDALKTTRKQLMQFVMNDENTQSQIRQLLSASSSSLPNNNNNNNINANNNNNKELSLTTSANNNAIVAAHNNPSSSSGWQLKRFVRSAMPPEANASAAWFAAFPSTMRQLAAAQHNAWQAKRFGGQEFLGKRFAGQEFLG